MLSAEQNVAKIKMLLYVLKNNTRSYFIIGLLLTYVLKLKLFFQIYNNLDCVELS